MLIAICFQAWFGWTIETIGTGDDVLFVCGESWFFMKWFFDGVHDGWCTKQRRHSLFKRVVRGCCDSEWLSFGIIYTFAKWENSWMGHDVGWVRKKRGKPHDSSFSLFFFNRNFLYFVNNGQCADLNFSAKKKGKESEKKAKFTEWKQK